MSSQLLRDARSFRAISRNSGGIRLRTRLLAFVANRHSAHHLFDRRLAGFDAEPLAEFRRTFVFWNLHHNFEQFPIHHLMICRMAEPNVPQTPCPLLGATGCERHDHA